MVAIRAPWPSGWPGNGLTGDSNDPRPSRSKFPPAINHKRSYCAELACDKYSFCL